MLTRRPMKNNIIIHAGYREEGYDVSLVEGVTG